MPSSSGQAGARIPVPGPDDANEGKKMFAPDKPTARAPVLVVTDQFHRRGASKEHLATEVMSATGEI
jgi:hypothetical protein